MVGQPTVGNSTRQCITGQCRNTRDLSNRRRLGGLYNKKNSLKIGLI